MDYLQKITSIFTALTLIFCLQTASAQSNIDTNRMNRDINIMENILQEMFKTQVQSEGNRFRVHSGGIFRFGSDDIRGTYLPGYGVIFTVPSSSPRFAVIGNSDSDSFSYSFEYGGNNNGEQVSQESITNRIVEFLRDYGSTIGQLSDDDKIMVIYKGNKPHREVAVFSSSDDEAKMKRQAIPTISVVATKSDLQTYRSGDIGDETFRNRLEISTAKANGNNQMDMKVMANIFETAFKESDKKTFRVSGSVDYLKLDNFGALFSFTARYSSNSMFAPPPPMSPDQIRSIEVIRDDEGKSQIRIRDKNDSTRTVEVDKERAQQKEEVIKAYNTFLRDLKEYIVDYGRTLKSVKDNQHILVSVTLSSRYDDIPERIDLQVQKSTLIAVDRGNISRDQAINEIQVREY